MNISNIILFIFFLSLILTTVYLIYLLTNKNKCPEQIPCPLCPTCPICPKCPPCPKDTPAKAIIVVRHSLDVDDKATPPRCPPKPPCDWHFDKDGYVKKLPNGEDVKYYQEGLSTEGIEQADGLALVLPKIVENLKLAPIEKVITKDPRSFDATPNPFNTIYPLIINENIKDVDLTTKSNIDYSLENGSVVICWDREGLWGDKEEKQPNEDSILKHLNSMYNVSKIDGPPVKGSTIYVYREMGSVDVYNLKMNPVRYEKGF